MNYMERTNSKLWLFIFILNNVVIYLASLFFPFSIILGNAYLSSFVALIITSLVLTLLLTLVYPLVKSLNLKSLTDLSWNLSYIVANIIFLWVLARLALYSGFGIVSFMVAIILGIVLAQLQYLIWKTLPKSKKQKRNR